MVYEVKYGNTICSNNKRKVRDYEDRMGVCLEE